MLSKMAQITIRTLSDTIQFDTEIDFNPIDLPYMCMLGYRNNCTSAADGIDLNKFWNMIDDFFNANNISTSNYVTLETIMHNGVRYGI